MQPLVRLWGWSGDLDGRAIAQPGCSRLPRPSSHLCTALQVEKLGPPLVNLVPAIVSVGNRTRPKGLQLQPQGPFFTPALMS